MSWYFPVGGNDYRISSGFGHRRAPIRGASTFHGGIDIAAPRGTPVIAPTDLTIISAGVAGKAGNLIKARDPQGNVLSFAHLDQIGVNVGDVIAGGSVIGAVGSTGNSTGNHLHFSVRDAAGALKNPSQILEGAKNLLGSAAKKVLGTVIPGSDIALDALGLGGGESWLTQFQNWMKDSDFFRRTGLVVLALILIGVAFVMFNSGTVKKTITQALKS